MSSVQVRLVRTAAERRIFLRFPWRIYQGDPLWVPHLLPERARRLDPRRGPFFQRGTAELFLAWQDGRPVGTICCAEDRAVNAQRGLHDCMVGFFDCLPDRAIAQALFDTAENWARLHGLDCLYGPFNLDYEDSYGVLIEGRDRPPVLLCGHTPPYYREMFEGCGFSPARGDGLAYEIGLDLNTPPMQRLARLADEVRRRGIFTVRGARLDRWDEEVDNILYLLNTATAHLPDFIPWQRPALEEMLAAFRQIADPELILFAEAGGRAVGWFPALPNLNEAFQQANGLRRPWDYLRLWLALRRQPACITIKSVLVLPEYWNRGAGILLFDEMAKRLQGRGYRWVDLSITSDDNPATPLLAGRMGARLYKRYRVYRRPVRQNLFP